MAARFACISTYISIKFQSTLQLKSQITSINFEFTCNEKYLKLIVDHEITKNDFLFNISFVRSISLYKFKVIGQSIIVNYEQFAAFQIGLQVLIPRDKNDKSFSREYPYIVVEICKLSQFIKSIPLYRNIVEGFLGCVKDSLDCPFVTVCIRFIF